MNQQPAITWTRYVGPGTCQCAMPCAKPRPKDLWTCSSGFTLIEVMVVVVILGLLAAIIVPKVMSRPDEARAVAAKADIAAITQALKLYRLDNTIYPSTEQGLAALVQRPTTQPAPLNWKQGGYLDRVPKDPW